MHCADETYSQGKKVGQWVEAHQKLNALEQKYEQMKAAKPRVDWRTTASGGPQMRKAINDAKKAAQQKNMALFLEAIQEFESSVN
eukprot:COSAG05_NODE_921_length_6590_cov_2.081985_5_plen_85_part_00